MARDTPSRTAASWSGQRMLGLWRCCDRRTRPGHRPGAVGGSALRSADHHRPHRERKPAARARTLTPSSGERCSQAAPAGGEDELPPVMPHVISPSEPGRLDADPVQRSPPFGDTPGRLAWRAGSRTRSPGRWRRWPRSTSGVQSGTLAGVRSSRRGTAGGPPRRVGRGAAWHSSSTRPAVGCGSPQLAMW